MRSRPSPRVALYALVLPLASLGCGGDGPSDDGGGGNGGGSGAGAGASIGSACEDSTAPFTGEATYYDFADGSGNCSFPATPGDLMVGAMNHADYAGSAACGACVEIEGPAGDTITVRIVDRCPECPAGDIDLSPEAFEQLAPLEQGRIDIAWRYVPCAVSGPVEYFFKEGSNPYWVAIQVRNHQHPIASLEVADDSGTYYELPRAEYNFFLEESGLGEGPYRVRITDTAGNQLEDEIAFAEATTVAGAAQFPGCAQ